MKIHVQGLCFSYRGHPVLNQVDLSVPSGSLCALLGANGAGKSTLLRCIGGILRPCAGRVDADGMDLLSLPPKRRAQLIGYVPQNAQATGSSLSVIETVLSGRTPHRRHRLQQEDYEIALSVLEQLGLENHALRELGQLSGGERQRVFIARALAQQPGILLLDEPTSSLDLYFQQETMELLRRLSAGQGITVLTVLHDLNAAIAYADQAVLLQDGRVRRAGMPDEVLQQREIQELFKVRPAFAELDGVRYLVPRRRDREPSV